MATPFIPNLSSARQPAQETDHEDFFELLKLKRKIDPDNTYLGESAAIVQVFLTIKTFNEDPMTPVLIHGPSGAGKSAIARLLHTSSSRRDKPYHREQSSVNLATDFSVIVSHWVGWGENPGIANASAKPIANTDRMSLQGRYDLGLD